MKTVWFIAILFSLTLTGCTTLSTRHMYNEPSGFHGVEFGSNINATPGVEIERQDGNAKRCYRRNDSLDYGGIAVRKITYVYYQDLLGEIVIAFNGLDNFTTIKGTFEQQHGLSLEQKQVNFQALSGALGKKQQIDDIPNDECTWVGRNVYMKMRYKSGEGVLQIQSIPVMLKYGKRW